jgi:DNA-binding response OmpR family regulator
MKIVAVSGKSYPVDKKRAEEIGVNRYLVKPFGFPELKEAVAELLGASS